LALLAYVATVFVVHVPWKAVLHETLLPTKSFQPDYVIAVVAVFGTTISPYLFFWQASQEVEEQRAKAGEEPLTIAPDQAKAELKRIKIDTYIGMGFSNLVAFFIMLTTAVTLHQHGITDIQTSAQAAAALRPLAGDFAFAIFSAGIIGTGLLAVPVLAGSAGYAVAEVAGWRDSLNLRLERGEGRGFYGVIAVATLGGVALCFAPMDPVRQLFWSAVFNGITAVPIMAAMMVLASRPAVMGHHVIGHKLRRLGWAATAVMALTVLALALA
jgi:Mn2+/Fe2+ NRAMP family transporter